MTDQADDIGEHKQVWTAQVNDLIGGTIVTDYPHPLSEHDHRKDGDQEKCGYVFAECMTMADAGTIADLLNRAGIERRFGEHFGRNKRLQEGEKS